MASFFGIFEKLMLSKELLRKFFDHDFSSSPDQVDFYEMARDSAYDSGVLAQKTPRRKICEATLLSNGLFSGAGTCEKLPRLALN